MASESGDHIESKVGSVTPAVSRGKRKHLAPQEQEEREFGQIVALITTARTKASRVINSALIDLYWHIGETISSRIQTNGWGKGTVEQLATYIQRNHAGLRGFSAQNLWRMRQFFEAYRDAPNLSTLLRDLPWSANLHILSKAKRLKEREFYLRAAKAQGWSVRELARQLDASAFEQAVLAPPKLSTALREMHPGAEQVFRDAYVVEFLDLPADHLEADLHTSLVRNMVRFLAELGRDFCFVGTQVPLQVGGRDFALDLLFFHRGLNCLVAIELKIGEFQPEHLGKLEFYLEALERDVRKPHEGSPIGMLLCAGKDDEVVEYALSRSMSPALVAEYKTRLPDRQLLQSKLHEFYSQTRGEQGEPVSGGQA